MSNNHLTPQSTETICSKGLRLLCKLLPDRTKRYIFLLSVISTMTLPEEDTIVSIAKLSQDLKLPEYKLLGELAMTLKSVAWKENESLFSFLTRERVPTQLTPKQECEYFVGACPIWLRYGTNDDMLRDVRTLTGLVETTSREVFA